MPWRLARSAIQVSALAACVWGSISIWWIVFSFLTFIYVSVDEPWPYWSGVWKDFVDAVVPCALVAGLIAVIFGLFFWLAHVSSRRKHRFITCVLSPICVTLPYTIWICTTAFVVITSDVFLTQNVFSRIADIKILQIASSCIWLPIMFIGWAVFVVLSIRAADKIALLHYRHVCECGYDLRGSIAGGSMKCPECGEDIPKWMLDKPPSIQVDS